MDNNLTKSFLALVTGILIIWGCSDQSIAPQPKDDSRPLLKEQTFGSQNGYIAKPFKADFFTSGGIQPGPESIARCGAPPLFFNVQEGSGVATHLGKFDVRITFCVDVTNFPVVPYNNGKGTFTAADGSKLEFTISGVVLPSDNPNYDLEFADPFEFVGGTGRFEGVSGSGTTNSLVTLEPEERTDHKWTGVLNIPK